MSEQEFPEVEGERPEDEKEYGEDGGGPFSDIDEDSKVNGFYSKTELKKQIEALWRDQRQMRGLIGASYNILNERKIKFDPYEFVVEACIRIMKAEDFTFSKSYTIRRSIINKMKNHVVIDLARYQGRSIQTTTLEDGYDPNEVQSPFDKLSKLRTRLLKTDHERTPAERKKEEASKKFPCPPNALGPSTRTPEEKLIDKEMNEKLIDKCKNRYLALEFIDCYIVGEMKGQRNDIMEELDIDLTEYDSLYTFIMRKIKEVRKELSNG